MYKIGDKVILTDFIGCSPDIMPKGTVGTICQIIHEESLSVVIEFPNGDKFVGPKNRITHYAEEVK